MWSRLKARLSRRSVSRSRYTPANLVAEIDGCSRLAVARDHRLFLDSQNRRSGVLGAGRKIGDGRPLLPLGDRLGTCPAGKELVQFRRTYAIPRSGVTAEGTRLYRASKLDCDVCKLKAQCCPNALARQIPRDQDEDARDVARALSTTPQYAEACRRRKKIEMLFAHLKRILRLTRLRLRGPNGARDEFLLAATAQNLRRLARLRPTIELPDAMAA
jgi:DDE family transposase